jgi:hypothetical protein
VERNEDAKADEEIKKVQSCPGFLQRLYVRVP